MPNTACRTSHRNPDRTPRGTDTCHRRARLTRLVALAAALCTAAPAWASDGHAAPNAAAKPAAKAPETAAAAAPAAATDPMDKLREKLAAKLGAAKAPESASPYGVRVVSKSADAAHGAAAAEPKAGGQSAAARAAKSRAAATAMPDGHAAHWAYGGAGGPEQWGGLKAEFYLQYRHTAKSDRYPQRRAG